MPKHEPVYWPSGGVAVVSPRRKEGLGNVRDTFTLRTTGDTTAESPAAVGFVARDRYRCRGIEI
jgi:hypothetical protein